MMNFFDDLMQIKNQMQTPSEKSIITTQTQCRDTKQESCSQKEQRLIKQFSKLIANTKIKKN
ncbi:hypothetical protein OQH60_00565 [Campylobacter sp. MIT 21-1685]|uniref:hypothetical protein n=1 Tax=unclassified Campylobacter TaxID=2593542 RepID=UPI00224A51D5|nr:MULTISPECIES: hypothetical protein [unclassified Campylobacter]MCX2682322.1 hypothetical protein [Campylobacter sp. MIT 21-1684]MCX2750602.1 hypothetical protein [Campylobacter sp. MIT 21-1682]MCX2806851.1 hypothetical protein [Campylobacter sp. MIT 21-1685]